MPRTLLTASVPVFVVALAWARQESPARVGEIFLVAILALVPAVARRWRWRLAIAVIGALAVVWIGLDAEPWGVVPGVPGDWLGAIGHGVPTGLGDYYEVALPFDPHERWEMHGLLLLAAYASGVAITFLVAAGRHVAAILALAIGSAWPATPVEARGALAIGVLTLVGALWLLAVPRVRSGPSAIAAAVTVVAVAVVATAAASGDAFARGPLLDWKSWDFYDLGGRNVSVRYVWDANYTGIDFPPRKTTLLRIAAPRRALYWRASTLDMFILDRWIENLYPVGIGPPGPLEPDPLVPAGARAAPNRLVQRVEVAGLDDRHLVAAPTPSSIESSSIDRVFYLSGGVLQATSKPQRGDRYVIASYVPRPTPAELVESRPRYPRDLARYLTLENTGLPAYGEAGRERTYTRIWGSDLEAAIHPYRPVYDLARRLTARAESPYAATLAIERWLRAGGGFAYDEHPPVAPGGTPALVDFITGHRRGYCQHFAGSMALMLRFLGIPARVAVGFTSGRYDDGTWVVTDHEAHAWVEAWFDGYGWLPFDPTPGRGRFAAEYSIASDSAEAARLLQDGDIGDLLATVAPIRPTTPTPARDTSTGDGPPTVLLLVLAITAFVTLLGLARIALRRLRYRTSDPRRLAAATLAELEAWLVDQRVRIAAGSSYAGVVAAAENGLGVDGRPYLRAVTAARFGRPQSAVASAGDARRELRLLVGEMRARLHRRDRLRGFLVPGRFAPRRWSRE